MTSGTTYYYRVIATNAIGDSSPSNEASARPSAPSTVPSAPTGLTASAVSSTQINLKWTAPTNNGGSPITGYKIERSKDAGTTWSTIVPNTGTTLTSYADKSLTPVTKYTYRVSAINSAGSSAPSNAATATTLAKTLSLTIKSADLSGNPITGMWVELHSASGATIATGYTPKTFYVSSGVTYAVYVSDWGTTVFNHWDNGSTNPERTITPTTNSTLTAYYSTS